MADGGEDLVFMRLIARREHAVAKLLDAFKKGPGLHHNARLCKDDIDEMLSAVRVLTVEVVEALTAKARRGAPFLWDGENYMEKLFGDLDVLDEVPRLAKWLGFGLTANPFIIPVTLVEETAAIERRAEALAAIPPPAPPTKPTPPDRPGRHVEAVVGPTASVESLDSTVSLGELAHVSTVVEPTASLSSVTDMGLPLIPEVVDALPMARIRAAEKAMYRALGVL